VSDPLSYQIAVRDASSRGDAESFYRLGCMLMGRELWPASAGCFARVVQLEPWHYQAMSNWGWSAHQSGRSEIGRLGLERALALEPREGAPHALLSQVLLHVGDVESAITHARRSVELDPQSAVNHVALALALTRGGQWEEGWREYEHRIFYKIPDFTTRPYRWWRGERVEHLYIEAEQGSGDAIFALRWVPMAAALAERVTLFVHQGLYSLVDAALQIPNVSVFPLPRPLPQADAWCPMLSLPAAMPYWSEPFYPGEYIDPGILVGWSGHDEKRPRRVAICWGGSSVHEQSRHRDCPLAEFLPLSEVPGVRLHSVQMGEGQAQFAEQACYGLIEDRSSEITNFADTAAVLAGMDLVISVDTAVAHLAGAMGVPCWMLVNRRGQDFRWGMEGERTGWFPSMRLFRRSLDEDWAAVMGRVASELRELVGGSGDRDHGAAAGRGCDAAAIGGGRSPVPAPG
jgi:hypothetical protein